MMTKFFKNFYDALIFLFGAALAAFMAIFVGSVIHKYAGVSGVLAYFLVWLAFIWAAITTSAKKS
jgi:protein-S-isoprenylcysteine O-methyltransferase Ste14